MRRMGISATILGSWLVLTGPIRAGVYNLNPPQSIYPSDFVLATTGNPTAALVYLGELRASNDLAPNAGKPEPNSLRAGFLRQTAELESKQREGKLSLEERVDLGACLIRMGRIGQATTVLEEAQRLAPAGAPCRFFLLANLASAYQENDDLIQRAIDTQTQALRVFPTRWEGWKRGQGLWYRRVETFALKLMALRNAEHRNSGGRSAGFQTVYPLFPRVRFVGPSGRYEAGRMDFAQWNELPFDAESIVLQLLFWRPLDNRLYWQYAELLNARGQMEVAYRIVDELIRAQQMRQSELQEHHRILNDAKKPAEEPEEAPPMRDWGSWVGGPREKPKPVRPGDTPVPTTATTSNWLPDWRHLTVSFVTGVVVALLLALQWRQWRPRNGERFSEPRP